MPHINSPNNIVPTMPRGSSDNSVANTQFVQQAIVNSSVATAVGTFGFGSFLVTLSSAQTTSSAGVFKITFNTKTFDLNNTFDAVTNNRWTPGQAGTYKVGIQATITNGISTTGPQVGLYKNGSPITFGSFADPNDILSVSVVDMLMSLSSTDFIEGFVSVNSSGTINSSFPIASPATFMWGHRVI